MHIRPAHCPASLHSRQHAYSRLLPPSASAGGRSSFQHHAQLATAPAHRQPRVAVRQHSLLKCTASPLGPAAGIVRPAVSQRSVPHTSYLLLLLVASSGLRLPLPIHACKLSGWASDRGPRTQLPPVPCNSCNRCQAPCETDPSTMRQATRKSCLQI